MRTLPLLENRKSGGDKVEDFLGKGDYQPTGQGQEPLRTPITRYSLYSYLTIMRNPFSFSAKYL